MADVHQQDKTCVECEVPQLARNHYFTGKLLVLRDFDDEQRYFIGKDRRHNQRLHGWGTVCGLKVKQHPQDGCRDRWVIVEPGSAIDCCGREIIVEHEEFFDFRAAFLAYWQHQFGKDAQPDDAEHRLQVCLRYAECPTENIPAVFDDCGCEDDACQPNRIRETYELGVIVDPETTAKDPFGVSLKWNNTVSTFDLFQFQRVVVHGDRLYVLTADDPGKLYVFDLAHSNVKIGEQALPARATDLALSADGSTAFVAVDQTDPILVIDTSALDPVNPPATALALSGVVDGDLRLIAPAAGGLIVLNRAAKQVSVWDTALTTHDDLAVGSDPRDIALIEHEFDLLRRRPRRRRRQGRQFDDPARHPDDHHAARHHARAASGHHHSGGIAALRRRHNQRRRAGRRRPARLAHTLPGARRSRQLRAQPIG